MEKYDDIYIVVVGYMNLSPALKKYQEKGRVIFHKFVSFQELQYEIGRVDVNIAPLSNNEFNEAKSELKFFEAGIVEVPSCVSATKIYKSVVTDGVDGFVCEEYEWFSKLERLYLDKELRKNMARAAYETAIKKYSPESMREKISKTYESILALK
jgi:glycosyltransferase involved in cell wall biosynthesis